ncbi:FeoA family protein [Flammeovirga aprica]|uniref:Ferrous iron transport protein A n=1 Tax=Flammeovirga aprica JL-4 TaxID=694437 RepID=A0A7X9RZ41_9BACT|nr:FeoA family protein [Flammeovirga aprica]NME71371.1 ferrous iron transport protein A [Flammeovirga aprica JL-4]
MGITNNLVSIDRLPLGKIGIITEFKDKVIGSRLIELGLYPGKPVSVIRKAPFKGALYLKSDNQSFAIGHQEAKTVLTTTSEK